LHKAEHADPNCGEHGELFELEQDNFRFVANSTVLRGTMNWLINRPVSYRTIYWLGFRPQRLYIHAAVEDGVVKCMGFRIWVTPPIPHFSRGIIDVSGSSPVQALCYPATSIAAEQSPFFLASRYFKWPQWNLGAAYSRSAPVELKDAVFDLRLGCVWS